MTFKYWQTYFTADKPQLCFTDFFAAFRVLESSMAMVMAHPTNGGQSPKKVQISNRTPMGVRLPHECQIHLERPPAPTPYVS